jgi:hypothetical protein
MVRRVGNDFLLIGHIEFHTLLERSPSTMGNNEANGRGLRLIIRVMSEQARSSGLRDRSPGA